MIRAAWLSLLTILLLFVVLSAPASVTAQGATTLQCGDIIDSEFTAPSQLFRYNITLAPGDRLTVVGTPGSSSLQFGVALTDPNGFIIASSDSIPRGMSVHGGAYINQAPQFVSNRMSSYGNYSLLLANALLNLDNQAAQLDKSVQGGIGPFQLAISCELSDGNIIDPGSSMTVARTRPQTLMIPQTIVEARGTPLLPCGGIHTTAFSSIDETHNYELEVPDGTESVFASVETEGDYLWADIIITDPLNKKLANAEFLQSPSVKAEVTSPGRYLIQVINWKSTYRNYKGGTGAYTLFVSCTMRDGRTLTPADSTKDTAVLPTPAAAASISAGGLPDFANAVKLPLIPATPMAGAITPAGGEILGFQLDANAGDVLDLSLKRLSGNLNLGLVVLSSSNEVVSYGGLITGDTLSTRLTLPSAGQYTIGVFRVDLLPPADPQATAFQVTGTLNP